MIFKGLFELKPFCDSMILGTVSKLQMKKELFLSQASTRKKNTLFLYVTLLQYPLLRMQSEQSVRLFYLSKQFFLHATKINVVILHFMLSGSQEGIGLDPETLLSSSILVKKAFKTHYTYLPIFH